MSVQVYGLRKWVRGLEAAGVDVQDLKRAFSAISRRGAAIAQHEAPKSTGRLAASVRGNKSKNKAVITAGRARIPYAGPINYGWPRRNIEPSLFMQRADRQLAPQALRLVSEELDDTLNRHVG